MEKRKTFSVRLGQPFDRTSHFFAFSIHAETQEEAARWVERVFPGAEASIVDCDTLKKHKVVNGVRVEVEVPKGNFRATEHRVLKELHQTFKKLTDEIGHARVNAAYWESESADQSVSEKDRRLFAATSTQKLLKATDWAQRLLKEIAELQQSKYAAA
jgi:hypothetical protein